MALFTGYFDESGHEHDPVFVMGGLVLDAEKIEEFDADWVEGMSGLPLHSDSGKPFLHTSDFMNGTKQYERWKGLYDEKRMILTRAAKIIYKHSLHTFTCVLQMRDYVSLNEKLQLSELLGLPYALLSRFCWEMVRTWKNNVQFPDPIAMVLESRHGGGDVYELFLNDKQPIPIPGDKMLPALQAADYISWMRQQRISPSGGYPHVRSTWNEINASLHWDWNLDKRDMLTICREVENEGRGPIPTRSESPDRQVRFVASEKRKRPQFKSR